MRRTPRARRSSASRWSRSSAASWGAADIDVDDTPSATAAGGYHACACPPSPTLPTHAIVATIDEPTDAVSVARPDPDGEIGSGANADAAPEPFVLGGRTPVEHARHGGPRRAPRVQPAPRPRSLPVSRFVDGGGLHARLPAAGPAGAGPQRRLPPSLRPRVARTCSPAGTACSATRSKRSGPSDSCRTSGSSSPCTRSTRPWGRTSAVGAGVVAALLTMTPIGLAALAWHGAIALALWAAVFAIRARNTGAVWSWAVAGLLGGVALSFRPDIVIAVSLTMLAAGWAHRRVALRPVLIGAFVGLGADVGPPRHRRTRSGDRRHRRRSRRPAASRPRAAEPALVRRDRRCAAGDRRGRAAVLADSGARRRTISSSSGSSR